MMRLFTLLICYLFLLTANATNNSIASITFSNPQEGHGISFVINNNSGTEAYTKSANIGDLACRLVPAGKYGYFRVDDALITPSDNKLILKLTYYDKGYGNFALQYNAINSKYQRINFKKTNSNSWITVTAALPDAAFNNLQNQRADFRISGEAYIRKVEFSKGELNPNDETVPQTTGSSYSEFKGKAVAGYQAWFTASETDADWVHWSYNGNSRPKIGHFSFEVYPDMNDYSEGVKIQSGFANFGNGGSATLFSSTDVIDVHFNWMKETGIDGVALQRFIGDTSYPIVNSDLAKPMKVKRAAEVNEKIFYICYDMSSGKTGDAWVESIKFDWVFNIEQNYKLTSSPAYARVNNKPVVQIWGPGFTSRVGTATGTIELIEFLHSRGCYVIGGVPTGWRTETRDSKTGFLNAYKTYDMVSPWTPGRYRDKSSIDNHTTNYTVPDKAFCDANNIDYMPVLFPGFAWSTWQKDGGSPNAIPRDNGEFLWYQACKIKNAGIKEMYFAMFDEYDEGTAIMKGATDWSQIPTDQYFLTYSADGQWLSSDFYLRLAGAATDMLKSSETPTDRVPIAYSEGPVYHRNSFEKRLTWYDATKDDVANFDASGVFNLDPCFYNPATISKSNISSSVCTIEEEATNSKSGIYYAKASGYPTSGVTANHYYKFAEVKIPVVDKLQLSFWKKTVNELGKYVSIDLIFKSGKQLSKLSAYKNNTGSNMAPSAGCGTVGAGWEQFSCEIGQGELLGDEITGILIAYDKPAASGSYTAYFDDILIETSENHTTVSPVLKDQNSPRITSIDGTLICKNIPLNSLVRIYDISGKVVSEFLLDNTEISSGLEKGIYVVSIMQKDKIYSQKVIF